MHVITKDIKKKRQALHEISIPIGIVCKNCFSNSTPISGANFSNNISIPQFRINMKEIEHDKTFETYELLTSRINPSIIL